MAQNIDGKWVVERAPAKQEIARMIGASREMVSRVVKDLHQKGLIRSEKRRIYVLDKLSMQKRASTRHSDRPPFVTGGGALRHRRSRACSSGRSPGLNQLNVIE